MAPVALLDPRPGETVCDLCAAPGGKTTQIAGRMAGRGCLLCNGWRPKRAQILSGNSERVLIDAPCSGEGMFRKEEAAVTDWSQETVEMCAGRQAQILEDGSKLVRPGGRLVYSTCTFAPEENEQAVRRFLEDHPDFYPEETDAPWFAAGENGSFRPERQAE